MKIIDEKMSFCCKKKFFLFAEINTHRPSGRGVQGPIRSDMSCCLLNYLTSGERVLFVFWHGFELVLVIKLDWIGIKSRLS